MYKKPDGFSLIELALVLIIVGLMYAAVFNAYGQYIKQSRLDDTYETMRLIQGAFTEYAARRGRYPCPARRGASPDDADYGLEDCAVTAVDTGRDVGEDTTGDTESILIGSIPFATMEPSLLDNKLLPKDVIDPWGNKYTYAVTQILTTRATYNDAWGVIGVTDEYGGSIITPPNTAHIIFYTHGANAKGAYSADGDLVDACNFITIPGPPPPGPTLITDIENCDEDDGNFVSGLINESDHFYFDDILRYQVNQISELWKLARTAPHPVSGQNINLYTNTNPSSVGIGIHDPDQKLEFEGSFIVTDDVIANEICSEAGEDCMPVSRITGNDPEMQCPDSTQAVRTIENGTVYCEPIFGTPVNDSCPPGQYVTGISNAGYVICSTP